MKLISALIFLIVAASFSQAKVWQMCDLARHLHFSHGFNRANLPDWMCLIQFESSFNSGAIGGPNANGSRDWGLWQINDGYWCINGRPRNDCNMDCRKLLDDDLTDDVACVRKIFARQGYSAWAAWRNRCRGKPLPNTNACF